MKGQTRVFGAVVSRSARQPEAAHQDSGRCGVCQARRQRQQCDSSHQDLGQRSPRQAQVGQAGHRQAKSHVKSASMRLCFGRSFLPVFLDLHALVSTSKLHVTCTATSTRLQCFYITHTHYYYPSLSLFISLTLAHTQTHTHGVDSIGGINTCLVQPSMRSRCLPSFAG